MRAASVLLAAAACAPAKAPIESCADDLSGIWAAADGRRFHLVERKDRLELYPLFDPTGPDKQRQPWLTPAKTELEREGAARVGRSTLQAQGRTLCTIATPARLEACAGDRAVLTVDLAPEVDLASCSARRRDLPKVEIRRL